MLFLRKNIGCVSCNKFSHFRQKTQALSEEKQPIPVQLGWYGTDVDGRILPHAADLPLLRDESESESDEQ